MLFEEYVMKLSETHRKLAQCTLSGVHTWRAEDCGVHSLPLRSQDSGIYEAKKLPAEPPAQPHASLASIMGSHTGAHSPLFPPAIQNQSLLLVSTFLYTCCTHNA